MTTKTLNWYYFTVISSILFILSVLAFSDNLSTDLGRENMMETLNYFPEGYTQ